MRFSRPSLACPAAVLAAVLLGGCSVIRNALPDDRPSLNTARAALGSGSPDVALQICEQRLADRPRDPELLVCRGDALTQLGRGSEAGAAFAAALAADPGSPDAQLGLGRLQLATDPAAAEATFLKALARSPRNASLLNNLGVARDLQGRHAEAQTAYGEAIAAAPDMRAPQVNLALSFAMTGRSAEAVRMLRPIGGRADATPRERHDLAAALAMDGKTDDAARLLRQDLDGAQVDDALTGYRSLPAQRTPRQP